MPENSTPTLTGYKRRIAAEFPQLSTGQVKATAKKVFWIAQNMHEVFDFYEALRVLGIHSDTTARDGIKNMEAAA